jgi:transposase
MVKHIFVGIDLGDKNSVARIAVDREKSERLGFVNNRQGRARLFREVNRRAQQGDGAKIVMAYEASSCGFVLSDEAKAEGVDCHVLAPTKMEKSVEQRKHKNDDRDAEDSLEKLRAHVLAGNRLPTVWVPDVQTRDDRELIRTRLELTEKQTQVKSQIPDVAETAWNRKAIGRRCQLDDTLSPVAERTGGIGIFRLGKSTGAEQFITSINVH